MSGLLTAITRRSLAFGQRVASAQAEGAMNAHVKIRRPAKPVFDPTTNRLGSGIATEPIYDGHARVSPVTGASAVSIGEEVLYYSTVFVTIPFSAPVRPRINDIVDVTVHLDPAAVNRSFRVTEVEVGGVMPTSYRVQATGIAPAANTRST